MYIYLISVYYQTAQVKTNRPHFNLVYYDNIMRGWQHPQVTSQTCQHRAAAHYTYLFILPVWWIARCGARRVNCRAGKRTLAKPIPLWSLCRRPNFNRFLNVKMEVATLNKETEGPETLRRFVSSSNRLASHHQYRGTSADRKWGSSHLMTGLVITPPPILPTTSPAERHSNHTRNKIIQKHLGYF